VKRRGPGGFAGGLAAFLVALGGCYTSEPPEVAEPGGDEVTIFVPGIKGSFLETECGERAWLDASDLLSKGDLSLALPPGGDDRFGPLHPRGVLTKFTLIPLVASASVYLPWLELGHDRIPGFLPFAYDWRQDVRESVLALSRRIDALAERRGGKLRVNLIGHSLGGLIAFAYVRYGGGDPAQGVTWAGARYVKRLALVGSPFGGSPSFLSDILRGDKNGRNVRLLAPEAMASFVSAYQLLPYPGTFFVDEAGKRLPLDASEAKTWEGVPPERRPTPSALAAARSFRQALVAPGPEAPHDLRILVVMGTGHDTTGQVRLTRKDEIDSADFASSPAVSGDNRVPEASCLPPVPSESYALVKTSADHVNLLNDEAVQKAVLDFLAH
jgi:pimeloyl-ACP methyl ester carboxylesterase